MKLLYVYVCLIVSMITSGCSALNEQKKQEAKNALAIEIDKKLSQLQEKLMNMPCESLPDEYNSLRHEIYKEIVE